MMFYCMSSSYCFATVGVFHGEGGFIEGFWDYESRSSVSKKPAGYLRISAINTVTI